MCVCVCVCVCIESTSSYMQDGTQGQFLAMFNRSDFRFFFFHDRCGIPRSVIVKELDYNLEINEFEIKSRSYILFLTDTHWKDINHLQLQLWIKLYHCCFSSRMAVNKLRSLICH